MKEHVLVSALLLLVGCHSIPKDPPVASTTSIPQTSTSAPVPASSISAKPSIAAKAPSPDAAKIVLRVGKDVITNTDIAERCRLIAALSHQDDDAEFRKNVRSQVKEKLIEEAVYEQMAERFNLDISEEMVKAYVEDYAGRTGTTSAKFKEALKGYGILDTFLRLIRAQIISSYITMSATQKDLLRVSEKQIDAEIAKMKANEKKRQYALSEIVFYSNGKVRAQEAATKTHQELVKMSQRMPAMKAFQALAQQLSQAPTASDGGYRGWVTESELDLASQKALKTLSLGHFSEPILVRPGEYRILYLNNIKEPGYAPHSQTRVEVCTVSIPLTRSTPPEQQAQIQRRVEALIKCTSRAEFEGVAKDFGYSSKITTQPLSNLPIDLASLNINACTPPVFTGKSLEIFMPLRRLDPPKSETKIDRAEVKESLEYRMKLTQARKVIQDFKNHILIQDCEH